MLQKICLWGLSFFSFTLFVTLPFQAISQNKKDTIYFNKDWTKTTRDSAMYFRVLVKETSGYRVIDHYMNGNIQMTGFLTSLQPEINDGDFKYYSEDGHLTDDINYKNGKRDGVSLSYNQNGHLIQEGYYKNNQEDSLWKHYDSEGHLWLTENYKNGKLNGPFISYYSDGKIKRKDLYNDGLMLKGTCYAESGEEIKYYPFQQKPEFKGDIYKYLAKKIKYPKKEQKANITGTVYIRFIVEKDGSVSNVTVFRGIPNGQGLEQEALRVISSMPKWKPGMQDGYTVRVTYMLPIKFSLH